MWLDADSLLLGDPILSPSLREGENLALSRFDPMNPTRATRQPAAAVLDQQYDVGHNTAHGKGDLSAATQQILNGAEYTTRRLNGTPTDIPMNMKVMAGKKRNDDTRSCTVCEGWSLFGFFGC